MSENLPILISDNVLDISSAKESVQSVAADIVKDLKNGQYLLAGCKLKMLEEVSKEAKELIKEKMSEEFSLRKSKTVVKGTIEVRSTGRQDLDYTPYQG